MMKCRKIPNSDLESHICPPPGKEPPCSSRTATALVCSSARRKKGLIYFQNRSKINFFDILLWGKKKKSVFSGIFIFCFPSFWSPAQYKLNFTAATHGLGQKYPCHKAFRLLPLDRYYFDVSSAGKASPAPFLLTFLLL